MHTHAYSDRAVPDNLSRAPCSTPPRPGTGHLLFHDLLLLLLELHAWDDAGLGDLRTPPKPLKHRIPLGGMGGLAAGLSLHHTPACGKRQ